MADKLTLAKQIIEKGRLLQDMELVAIGMEMLNEEEKIPDINSGSIKSNNENIITINASQYVEKYTCSKCGHSFIKDRDNRKKCPKCKSNTLMLTDGIAFQENIPTKTSHRVTASDFETQIRKPSANKSRIRYNDLGQPEGTYAKVEQVEGVSNVWKDDGVEGYDEANEKLKLFTKHTPRNRQPVKLIKAVCENCKNEYSVHPIHAGGRGRYLCDRCISRRSKI